MTNAIVTIVIIGRDGGRRRSVEEFIYLKMTDQTDIHMYRAHSSCRLLGRLIWLPDALLGCKLIHLVEPL